MKTTTFKSKWNDVSKLDKFGYITYSILSISSLIILVYYACFTPIIRNMFLIMGLSKIIPLSFRVIGVIAIAMGLVRIWDIFYLIVEAIFYPETNFDKFIKTKKREVFNKYPIKIAELKLKESKLKYELNKVREKIKEIQNE